MRNRMIIAALMLSVVGSVWSQPLRNAVFLHHSTGGAIWGPNGSATSVPAEVDVYNNLHGYSGNNAAVMAEKSWPPTPWDNEWERWHRIFENRDTVDADIRPVIKEYGTIVIKSCFPSSSIGGNGNASDTLMPTRKTIFNYKWHWRTFIRIMQQHPNNFFGVWTNAPRTAQTTYDDQPLLADQFCRWAKDTLAEGKDDEFGPFPKNVYVFDFFHKLTGQDGKMRPEYAVDSLDPHPNAAATALVAPQFVREILDAAIAYEEEVTPPPAPLLVSPVSGLVVNTDTVRMVWQYPGHNVTRYCYEQGGDSLFLNSTVDSTITDTLFTVRSLLNSRNYWWRVKAGNGAGWGSYSNPRVFSVLVTSVGGESRHPGEFRLGQNYPNPFNPATNIQFSIVNRQLTIMKVYDVLGREVAMLVNDVKEPGTHTVQFDGSNLPGGVYFCRLQARDFTQSKKLILLK